MSYITNEQVAEKRKAIKAEFPTWKFSITRKHMTSISVNILEADIKLTEKENGYEQVNHFYIKENYKGDIQEALQKISDIITTDERTLYVDSDYGNIPNFYANLSIGQWNKPFVYKQV
jgi:hypothetical protein